MKKSMAILLTAAMSASLLAGCGSSSQSSSSAPAEKTTADSSSSSKENADAAPEEGADASYTIGIGQFAEHGSLDNCREGFIQGLARKEPILPSSTAMLRQTAVQPARLPIPLQGKMLI